MKRLLPLITTGIFLAVSFGPAAAFARALPTPTSQGSYHQLPANTQVSRRAIEQQARSFSAVHASQITVKDPFLPLAYDNATYGIHFNYPPNWQKVDTNQAQDNLALPVMLLQSGATKTIYKNINVVIEDMSAHPLSLNDYTAQSIKNEKDFLGSFTLTDAGYTTLGGYAAYRIDFTAPMQGLTMKFEQVWALKGNIAYVWTFRDDPQNFAADLNVFQRILGTFKVQ